jgi:hypothetical protein
MIFVKMTPHNFMLSYLAEAKQRGSTNILKIGLAFCGKRFKIKYSHFAEMA